jgi:hypothetical protein
LRPPSIFLFRLHTLFSPKGRVAYATRIQSKEKKMEKETYRFIWQSIEVEVAYDPQFCGIIAHLEIKSINPERAPLPITKSGYRSNFCPCGVIEAQEGGVVEQVIAWLDEEAQKPEWQKYIGASNQGELF